MSDNNLNDKVANKENITLSLTKEEYDMLVSRLDWVRCMIWDTGNALNYENYCNGQCGTSDCNGKGVLTSKEFFESRIVNTK